MKAKDIENKIKGLYKNVEPDHFEVSDDKILRYERQALQSKERWSNLTPEQKEKQLRKVRQANYDKWSTVGT